MPDSVKDLVFEDGVRFNQPAGHLECREALTDAVIVLLSAASNQSEMVAYEVEIAQELIGVAATVFQRLQGVLIIPG